MRAGNLASCVINSSVFLWALHSKVYKFQKPYGICPIKLKLPTALTRYRDMWPNYWVGFSTLIVMLTLSLAFL